MNKPSPATVAFHKFAAEPLVQALGVDQASFIAGYEIAALQRDELLVALKGTMHVFADQAEATRALTKAELEQIQFARAVIAKARA